MKEKAKELKNKVKERVQTAQKQVHDLEEDVQKFVSGIQDKLMSNSAEGIRKVDELIKALAVKDFLERIRNVEVVKQGQEFRKDLLNRFGIASTAELNSLKEELAGIRKSISDLETKVTSAAKRTEGVQRKAMDAIKRRIDKLEKGMSEGK